MKNYDSYQHVRGESLFLDDLTSPEGVLHATIFSSPIAHGLIRTIDFLEALDSSGVKAILSAKDIPGQNQIGGIIPDEVLLASEKVDYIGQPIALVIADSYLNAKKASNKIKINLEKLPPIFDPREAFINNSLIIPSRTFEIGDVERAWKSCDLIIEGTADSGGQEHLYLETQAALAYPQEGNKIKIISSTQSPTAVQRTTARVLAIKMNQIEVDVTRLGGGFGGKEDQATAWAVMAALGTYKLKAPVKLVLKRNDDMQMTGKRHPYSSDFKIGLTNDLKILAYEVTFYQNAGAAADLSPAILERTLFHTTNSYFIPNVKATGISCKTNLPPNTAFRGFGGPQAMFVIESAIFKAAEKLGVDPFEIQEKNLLNEGDEFPFGQRAENCNARKTWNELKRKINFEKTKVNIKNFNQENNLIKKGFALMPICFGISFTNTLMNQANALVHIYTDGSVGISTAAVEMGQGVNHKLRQVAAEIFSIDLEKVSIESTNTTRSANTSPTAASSAADLNGKALENACRIILDRIITNIARELKVDDLKRLLIKKNILLLDNKPTEFTWEKLIQKTYTDRVSLSAQAHYATPGIYFNRNINKGKAFAYHVYGTAFIETALDCLRGIYKITDVKIVHDFGKSLNPVIDKGQAEGALIQGLGWMTIEEVIYDERGKLITDTLSTYKVPDLHFTPDNVEINFLEDSENPMGIFNSKAIGEPPLMYGIGGYFAIANAIKAFKQDTNIDCKAPMTPEKVLMSLYSKSFKQKPLKITNES